MTAFTLDIETIGAVAPGSGTGSAGAVDREVVHDDLGLPVLPGRRMKGVLKEAAQEVYEVLSLCGLWDEALLMVPDDLFGTPGQGASCALDIRRAQLVGHKPLADWLRYATRMHSSAGLFHPEAVLQNYCETRGQTAMDPGTGGPTQNSLRVTRLLKKGVCFEAKGQIDALSPADTERALNTLVLACRQLRRMGLSRNRGPGRIFVKINCPEAATAEEIFERLGSEKEGVTA